MEDLKIAYIQYDMSWEDSDQNRKRLTELIEEKYTDASLIVLPEMFATGFSMNIDLIAEAMDGPTMTWMKSMSKELACVICGSLPILENGKYYNRFVFVDRGKVNAYYDKIHLFTPSEEHLNYSAGGKDIIVQIGEWKVKPLVCYDLRFPSCALNYSGGYDVLIYVASWPEKRTHHWTRLLQARAIENQSYCLGVNRVGRDGNDLNYIGHSAVYDFNGDPISSAHEEIGYFKARLTRTHLDFRKKLNFLGDRREL